MTAIFWKALAAMRYVRAFLPAILWMAMIFMASTDVGSSERTSRIIGPILRWFKPDVKVETIRAVQLVVRKCAHLTVYGMLAALTWAGLRMLGGNFKEFHWNEALGIVPFCFLYAVSDELHQSFVPSRQGSPWDVLIDTAGAAGALVLIWAFGRWRKYW